MRKMTMDTIGSKKRSTQSCIGIARKVNCQLEPFKSRVLEQNNRTVLGAFLLFILACIKTSLRLRERMSPLYLFIMANLLKMP